MPDFIGHHRETTPLLTGPGRLDGRVECQQVGLFGNPADGLDDAADHQGLLVEGANAFAGLLHVLGQIAHHVHRLGNHRGAALGAVVGLQRGVVGNARCLGHGQFLVYLVGDHGGELHHFVEFVVGVHDRVVGSLQPDHPAMSVDALEALGDELPGVKAFPEGLVGLAVVLLRLAEDAVMLALNLRQAVAHAGKEAVIGRQHVAVEVELDQRGGTHQGANQVLVLPRGLDGAGQVAGEDREILDPPLGVANRLGDGTQPGFLAIAAQQPHRPGKVFAPGQGRLEPQVKLIMLDVFRDDVLQGPAHQIASLVEHFLGEIVIDRLNPSIGAQVDDEHLAFKALLHLLKARKFFA